MSNEIMGIVSCCIFLKSFDFFREIFFTPPSSENEKAIVSF